MGLNAIFIYTMPLIKCTDCGQMVSDKAKACPKCGCQVIPPKKEIQCPECGNSVFEDSMECSECGFPFKESFICPECQSQIDETSAKCNICGFPLNKDINSSTSNNFNENIVLEKSANMLRGIESVGGKLIISNLRIIFKSHSVNFQKGETEIIINEISDLGQSMLPNAMWINTKSGKKYQFIIWGRSEIISLINNLRR